MVNITTNGEQVSSQKNQTDKALHFAVCVTKEKIKRLLLPKRRYSSGALGWFILDSNTWNV